MAATAEAVAVPVPEKETHPLLPDRPLGDVWTTDDLDAMPETPLHVELLDGTLIVSPSATDGHQTAVWRLPGVLDETCPERYHVTQNVEVRISRYRSFIPDVLVVTTEASRRHAQRFTPDEVVLAVEIVSPSSRTIDAVIKPTAYAEAGIGLYWRIETQPVMTVHTYRLDDEVYVPTGSYDQTVATDEPWPMTFDVARLKPRWQR